MKLAEYGIGRRELHAAIDAFRAGATVPAKNFSWSTYLVNPGDSTAWDLKPVVVKASELVQGSGGGTPMLRAADFNTVAFLEEILAMGFAILRFDQLDGSRKLGLRGFDALALNDAHVLRLPDGSEIANGFAAIVSTVTGGNPGQVQFVGHRFLRNSDLVRQVLLRAKGMCENCGNKVFQTPAGVWFLEVHHKQWLSEGGADQLENMTALCPNCHRQEHHGMQRRYH
jgi:5-methylcytosine-specific restriction protein A